MPGDFSWMEIMGIAGWPLWLVLGCNSLLITLIYERLWYLWKPLQMRSRWLKGQVKGGVTKKEWENLFFQEQRRVHIGFPLIRNLIIICPLVGLLGSLFNLMQLLQLEGFEPFYTSTMYSYMVIRLALPVCIGLGSAMVGWVALRLYVKGVKSFIRNYPRLLSKKVRVQGSVL